MSGFYPDNGGTKVEIGHNPTSDFNIAISLTTATLSAWYGIAVTAGLWSYLGVSWDSNQKSLTIQK